MIGKLLKNTRYKILTKEGYKKFHGLIQLPSVRTLSITLEDGKKISVSPNHKFVVEDIKISANELIEGELLETENGLKQITKIEISKEKNKIYDILEVGSKQHSFYSNGILNSNCAFLGSANTLIDGSFLERLDPKVPVELKMGSYLNIYEPPKKDQMYIISVDSSKGVGKDYSVIQVLKINSEHDIDQVAMYRNNQIEPKDFAQVVISVSEYYNGAYIMIENNDVGEIVANEIWYGYDYDKILNCDKKGIGIRSTRKTKLAGNMLLKRYVENGWLGIVDKTTIYELSRYEEVKPNVFHCPEKINDDCVTSLIWGLYFVTTTFFDGKNVDIKKIDDKFLVDPDSKDVDNTPIMFDGEGEDASNPDIPKEGWGFNDGFDDDPGYGGFVF